MSAGFSIIEREGVRLISVDCINRLGNYRAYYSTGFGGVSEMPGGCTMNLAMFKNCRNDCFENARENFSRFARACGFPLERMSLHRQVHEPGVTAVTAADIPADVFDREAYGTSDAQVTVDRAVALFVYAADCCTILLVDPVGEVSGTAHCGWRNSLNGTIPALVREFERLGGRPERSVAALGPCICAEHYSVDAEAAERFEQQGFGGWLGALTQNGRRHIDLAGINRRQLESLGLPPENIHAAPWCTWEGGGLALPSYRRDGGLNAMLGGVLYHI